MTESEQAAKIELIAQAIMDGMEKENAEQGRFNGSLPREKYLPTIRKYAVSVLEALSCGESIEADNLRGQYDGLLQDHCVEVNKLNAEIARLKGEVERLTDLVRYCRHQLHEEGLITDEEFAAIVSQGSDSARRLEGYDSLRAELATKEQELAEAVRKIIAGLGDVIEGRTTPLEEARRRAKEGQQ